MRKRSKYKPRPVILDTMRWCRQGFSTLDSHSAAVDFRIKNHIALQAVIEGTAKPCDIDTLIDMSNISMALNKQGVGSEYRNIAIAGAEAIESLKERGSKTGRFVCTGLELTAIKDLAELHDQQLSMIRVNDLGEAVNLVRKKTA